jgi:hypothetical protein
VSASQRTAIEPGLKVHGIEFTSEGIFEHDDGRRTVFIDKATVRRGSFRRGFVAERIGIATGFGLVLVCGGAWIMYSFYINLTSGSLGPVRGVRRAGVAGVMCFVIGLFLVRHALRRGVYLDLDTDRGRRKLAVGKSAAADDLRTAVREAKRDYGYILELSVDDFNA